MSESKRLRIFAGPNGSGKSTLFTDISSRFNVGFFVNSDDIEKEIFNTRYINLEKFGLALSQADLISFFQEKDAVTLLAKSKEAGHPIDIEVRENVIVNKSKDTHSYEAALVTSFIRKKLLENGISYSFETVMSHISKLNEIQRANKLDYKTYLYFVCLDDPQLNISRVLDRVEKGGHPVPQDKIVDRYQKALTNLLPAIKIAKKTDLIDNSGESMVIVAETQDGHIIWEADKDKRPNWYIEYVTNKLQ